MMVQSSIGEWMKSNKDVEYTCPYCGTPIPEHLVGCWNCSAILNKHIAELYKQQQKEKQKK